jgi:hypothetical protein
MHKDIAKDFLSGIITSVRFDLFIKPFYVNTKFRYLLLKIIAYNILLHFLPCMMLNLVNWLFNISMMISNVFLFPINLFSILFHLLHYMDLINMVSIYSTKTSNSGETLDLLSLTITMSIYQFVIFITTAVINIFFHIFFNTEFFFIAFFINLFILMVYHSFYCFNNLWQYKKIKMSHRIDMHEKLWPYYTGYGIISSILYLYSTNPIILGIYNLYMAIIISIPFMLEPKYPIKNMMYPYINLTIFSYMTGFIFTLSKKLLKQS